MSASDEAGRRSLLELHQAALFELAKFEDVGSDDQDLAFRILTDVAARTLEVERSSIWVFDEERTKITCLMLFERSTRSFTKGNELRAADVPSYFAAVEQNRAVAADDAQNDPRMAEISEIYLKPLGIVSMLDAPIRLGGRVAGIVCNEHIGAPRVWSQEEQNFAASISDMAAVTLEHSERVRAEAEIRRRDEMLDGVAKAANRMFANAERDLSYQEALLGALAELASRVLGARPAEPGILGVIGTALRADCVATFEHAGPLPALRSIEPSEVWTTSDDPRDMTLASGSALPSAWLTALNEGDTAGGAVESLPVQQKRAFEARGVRSTILAPLVSQGDHVGLLEIDDDTADREWTRAEEHFVRACGLLLGALKA